VIEKHAIRRFFVFFKHWVRGKVGNGLKMAKKGHLRASYANALPLVGCSTLQVIGASSNAFQRFLKKT